MADRITEVLEDGTIYCFDMEKCIKQADEVLDELYKKEGVEIDFDYTATVFSLFVKSLQILHESGWTTTDLINEVLTYTQDIDIDEDE
jgi:hypothetical protein